MKWGLPRGKWGRSVVIKHVCEKFGHVCKEVCSMLHFVHLARYISPDTFPNISICPSGCNCTPWLCEKGNHHSIICAQIDQVCSSFIDNAAHLNNSGSDKLSKKPTSAANPPLSEFDTTYIISNQLVAACNWITIYKWLSFLSIYR